jgi:hypothetical protein
VLFVEVIQPTIDCITDEIVLIQRFRFPIVSQMTSIRIGHVATRDCEKNVSSVVQVLRGLGLPSPRTYKIVTADCGAMKSVR